jgi:hypothetical protein
MRTEAKAFLSAAALLCASAAHSQDRLRSKVDIRFDRFHPAGEIDAALQALAAAHPGLCRVERIGTSALGRPMLALVVNNPATGAEGSKPGMYIDGGIHANEIQAPEAVLYTAWHLLSAYGSVPRITDIVDRTTFYLLPMVNPDGRVEWFEQPNTPNSARTGQAPTDNDGDGQHDEDPPNDLDGDGHITQMWRRDPLGSHRRDPRDPNRMVEVPTAPKADGTREYGDWSQEGQEGVDDDGDGSVNEDGPGGYDMNRNFPSGWEPENVQGGAGRYPLCWPETRAVADWMVGKPHLAAAQAYHNAGGMILRGPGAAHRDDAYPGQDVAVYERIQAVGATMLPDYRPMVIHRDLYTVHGGLVNWFGEGLGIVSFTNEMWTDKRIMQDGAAPSEDERRTWDELVLLGRGRTPLREVPHPQFGTVLVGGGSKFSARIPPSFMLEEELHRNFAFTMFHADQLPLLRLEAATSREIAPGLWQVTVSVANDRVIPTRMAHAAAKGIGLDDEARLEGARVVASGIASRQSDPVLRPVPFLPATVRFPEGVPGEGSATARFLVEGSAGTTLTFRWRAEKAKDLEAAITLGAPDGGTAAPAQPPAADRR